MDTKAPISENSRRIARNTALLYVRMTVMLLVGLYTSRVVLNALGQDDFGIYGAVGGVVALFGILTGSVSGAISRFMAFELGKAEKRMEEVFSTTVFIQAVLALAVLLLAEWLGVWFLNAKMVIPEGRMGAANLVLQCSIGVFVLNMLAVPYNAAIIAHEKMEAFAYISIAEALLALGAALATSFAPTDKLKLYALLMLAVAVLVRLLYAVYAKRHFEECRFRRSKVSRPMVREMGSFAGWTFLGNGAYVLNAQGINLLFNIFFGVRVNAARDVTVKLDGNMTRFIGNITTAINPQINKSYASGNLPYTHELVCKGARYSYLLYFFFAFPIILEAPELLRLWLGTVPDHAAAFVRIAMLASLFTAMGAPFAHAVFATGKVKTYEIVASATNVLAFPLSWIAFKLGGSPETAYWIIVGATVAVFIERVAFTCSQTGLPFRKVLGDVFAKSLSATAAAVVVPLLLFLLQEPSTARTLEVVFSSFVTTALAAFFLGSTPGERQAILNSIKNKLHKNEKA